jgi:hypothetical protein
MAWLPSTKILFIPLQRIGFDAIPKTYSSFNNSEIALFTNCGKILHTVALQS